MLDATVLAGGTPTVVPGGASPGGGGPGETRERLGPYRLLRRLGGGGMGQIYLAVQESLGRQVALKILPPGFMEGSGAFERFQREIQVLSQLQHPNICAVLEAGSQDGTHFYAMEFLRGMDLARVLKTQRLDERRAAAVAVQVARALHFAHQKGIIHRDIKPLNVMLVRGERLRAGGASHGSGTTLGTSLFRFFRKRVKEAGAAAAAAGPAVVESTMADPHAPSPEYEDRAYVIDFGLARDGARSGSGLTVTGEVVGTPSYMAPEQARGEQDLIGPATDVYSLGATLYEMLTLRPPFTGESVAEVIHNVIHSDAIPPRRLVPAIDRDLETIVMKAIEKSPGRRYASAAGMADDLERWLAGLPILARPASLAYRLARRIARNRAAAAAIAVAASIALAGAWANYRPGRIEFLGDLEGCRFFVGPDEASPDGATIWPPGKRRVRVVREGFEPLERDVTVGSGGREQVEVALVSSFGRLDVTSDPAGAEVWLDDRLAGTTPYSAQVLTGRHGILVRLANHEEVPHAPVVEPGKTASFRALLRHEQGRLTVTCAPSVITLELTRPGEETGLSLAAPMRDFPIDTGPWTAVAKSENHGTSRFSFTIRKGVTEARHVSLMPHLLWTAQTESANCQIGDLDGDGLDDIVSKSPNPPRIRGIRGATGQTIWVRDAPDPPGDGTEFALVLDVDGDLENDVLFVDHRGHVVQLDGPTGNVRRTIPAPGARDVVEFGDIDGDALPELLLLTADSVAAWDPRAARERWRFRGLPEVNALPGRLNKDAVPDVIAWRTSWGAVADTRSGFVAALDGRDGSVLWRTEEPPESTPQVADFDGDGLDDVFFANARKAGSAKFWLSGLDGGVIHTAPAGGGLHSDTAGDMDGDGFPEVLRSTPPDGLSVFDGRTRERVHVYPGLGGWNPPVLADTTGDGRPEILVMGPGGIHIVDHAQRRTVGVLATPSCDRRAALADLDGDGRQDFVVPCSDGTVRAFALEPPPVLWKSRASDYNAVTVMQVPGAEPALLVQDADGSLLRPGDGFRLGASTRLSGKAAFYRTPDGRARAFVAGNTRSVDLESLDTLWESPACMGLSWPFVADLTGDGYPDCLSGDLVWNNPVGVYDGKSGQLLWKRLDLRRMTYVHDAYAEGLLWIAAPDGLHAVRPLTGEDVRVHRFQARPCSVRAVDRDLVVGVTDGHIIRFRPSPDGSISETWRALTPSGMTSTSPAIGARRAVAVALSGVLTSVDLETGRVSWSRRFPGSAHGGPALRDLDSDGIEEAAVACRSGWVLVFSGTDGAERSRANLRGETGETTPLWIDADGEGDPEIVFTNRDGFTYALRVTPPSVRPVRWPSNVSNQAVAHAGFPAAEALRLAAEMLATGRDADLPDLARRMPTAFTCARAARACAALGRRSEAAAFAEEARRRGARLAELEFLRCAELPPGQGPAELARALAELPLRQLLRIPVPAAATPLGRAAADSLALTPGVSPERAVTVLTISGLRERAVAATRAAVASGVDPGPLLLARGRAAAAAGRDEEAVEDLRAAAEIRSSAEEARAELASLAGLAVDFMVRGTSAWQRGDTAGALELLERSVRLDPEVAEAWNNLAWIAATGAGATPERGRRAVEAAERAVALAREVDFPSPSTVAMYLDTLAAAWFTAGDPARALACQEEALALPIDPGQRAELSAPLEKYRKAAGASR